MPQSRSCRSRSLPSLLALALPATASAAPPPGFVGMTADDLFGNGGSYRDKGLEQQQTAGVQLLRVDVQLGG